MAQQHTPCVRHRSVKPTLVCQLANKSYYSRCPGEVIPEPVLCFIAAQLGLKTEDILPYAARDVTRREHLGALRKIYGYRMFAGKRVKQMKAWLGQQAEAANSNEGLVRAFVEECRRRKIVLPGISVIERLCADALVAAEGEVLKLLGICRRCILRGDSSSTGFSL